MAAYRVARAHIVEGGDATKKARPGSGGRASAHRSRPLRYFESMR